MSVWVPSQGEAKANGSDVHHEVVHETEFGPIVTSVGVNASSAFEEQCRHGSKVPLGGSDSRGRNLSRLVSAYVVPVSISTAGYTHTSFVVRYNFPDTGKGLGFHAKRPTRGFYCSGDAGVWNSSGCTTSVAAGIRRQWMEFFLDQILPGSEYASKRIAFATGARKLLVTLFDQVRPTWKSTGDLEKSSEWLNDAEAMELWENSMRASLVKAARFQVVAMMIGQHMNHRKERTTEIESASLLRNMLHSAVETGRTFDDHVYHYLSKEKTCSDFASQVVVICNVANRNLWYAPQDFLDVCRPRRTALPGLGRSTIELRAVSLFLCNAIRVGEDPFDRLSVQLDLDIPFHPYMPVPPAPPGAPVPVVTLDQNPEGPVERLWSNYQPFLGQTTLLAAAMSSEPEPIRVCLRTSFSQYIQCVKNGAQNLGDGALKAKHALDQCLTSD